MKRRGFTIVELLVVITIMGALLVLSVVNLRGSQMSARDAERKVDIEAITSNLETYYISGSDNTQTTGRYPSTMLVSGSTSSFPVKALVVGGGGGGGGGENTSAGDAAGGGGGGGLIYNNSFAVAVQSYAVTVGNGGNGAAGYSQNGSNGGNSIFGTLTAVGGGYGSKEEGNGAPGGSGGGAGGSCNSGNKTGGATNGQGFKGQDNIDGACLYRGGSGGGGTGAVGGYNLSNGGGGAGGTAISNSISGSSVFYAGGGGGGAGRNVGNLGGAGQSGGGSGGASAGAGNSASANTGSGGGGAGSGSTTGGNGGSGIVIISHLSASLTATGGTITYTDANNQNPRSTLAYSGGNTIHKFTGNGTFDVTAITDYNTTSILRDLDMASITAPGVENWTQTFVAATNNVQTTGGVTPQPSINQYVYQPIQSDGTLCTFESQECRKFNLYYKLETDNTVYMTTGKKQ